VTTLVIGGDSNINELSRRISVAKSNNGDVNIGGFFDGLGIGAGVGNDNKARLLKRTSDVVGEVTGSKTTGDGGSASVSSKLQDGTLTERTSRDSADVGGIVNCGDNPSGEDNLFPKSN
jgi:hypothetical protein